MQRSPLVLVLAFGMLLADSGMAEAQTRMKDDSRRVTAREPASADRGDRRRDTTRETAARQPIRQTVHARPRDDDRRDRDLRYHDRRDLGARVIILRPGHRLSGSMYGYGSVYGSSHGYDYSGRRVWNREPGMTCLRLDDELDWAHDEWHHRNDRNDRDSWYEVEHARLELRIAEERAYSGCGRTLHERDCRERGFHRRTGSTLEVAILVLDILLGDGRDRRGR